MISKTSTSHLLVFPALLISLALSACMPLTTSEAEFNRDLDTSIQSCKDLPAARPAAKAVSKDLPAAMSSHPDNDLTAAQMALQYLFALAAVVVVASVAAALYKEDEGSCSDLLEDETNLRGNV